MTGAAPRCPAPSPTLLLRDALPVLTRSVAAFPEAITEADLTALGLGLGTTARAVAETISPPPSTADLFIPPPFTQAWARGRHSTSTVISYMRLVHEFLTHLGYTAPEVAEPLLAAPVTAILPWGIVLSYSQVEFAFPVTRTVLAYTHIEHGWAHLAAGLSPQEAVGVPVEDALAMAALRGITLPHPDSLQKLTQEKQDASPPLRNGWAWTVRCRWGAGKAPGGPAARPSPAATPASPTRPRSPRRPPER